MIFSEKEHYVRSVWQRNVSSESFSPLLRPCGTLSTCPQFPGIFHSAFCTIFDLVKGQLIHISVQSHQATAMISVPPPPSV